MSIGRYYTGAPHTAMAPARDVRARLGRRRLGSAVNDWTRAAAQPGDLTVSATVSATYDAFGLDAYNEFVLDPDAWDWSQDLVDDWLTIGIDEVAGGYRYVYFYGTDDPQTRPYVELDICE
ncbi:MAG: hypothetical protein R3A79_21025 [Nannocystaceae bacterium]